MRLSPYRAAIDLRDRDQRQAQVAHIRQQAVQHGLVDHGPRMTGVPSLSCMPMLLCP
jgi:hypothetical protein